ncbi:hypothetical protein QNI16_25275 [Cytophagaceae bacterium YF14B1]|uniref:Uncharacterized protein n=1 Tax=Xanthocytophaga flava TaxID=3048013 RepID=A0AAE3QQX2_9BACT|nr:hypothetical protein [Xanthocytophaga flavus]MDJ1483837.1 hypothetical protein [Xanthocytophaga flavus]
MAKLLTFLLFLLVTTSFGQTDNKQNCKIEFYLLKSVKPNLDTTSKLRGSFAVSKADLEDTAFIQDHEILGYNFRKDTARSKGLNFITIQQSFEVALDVTKKINSLNISLSQGRQFALVVNGTIVYSGYFWNILSSFGCDGITAVAIGTKIDISRKLPDYDSVFNSEDPIQSKVLMNCLLKTNRLRR